MNEISETILKSFQTRKTRRQKDAFISLLRSRYPQLQVQALGKHRNLILGDVEKAKVVYTAHYDTCAAGLFPNLVLPYKKGLKLGYTLLALLPIILASVAAGLLVQSLGASRQQMLLAVLAVYYGLFFGKYFLSPANPHTANDNTSGVITLLETYQAMTPEQREKAALVFFDNEELGCQGSKAFYKAHKEIMSDKLLLNFDCVSEGDVFLFVCPEGVDREPLQAAFTPMEGKRVVFDSRKHADHSSDHKHFSLGVAVSAMKSSPFLGLYIDKIHTKKDQVLQRENIDFFKNGAIKLLEIL